MNKYTFDNIIYVSADDVMTETPKYSKGCRNIRDIIKKRNVPEEDYVIQLKPYPQV